MESFMDRIRKYVWILWAAVLLAALLTACGSGEDNGGTESSDSVKIGVLRIADSVPLYVAEEEGIFDKYGVDAEIVEFGNASDQSQAMEAGAIDVMMTDMIVQCMIIKGGTDIRTIATALGADVTDGRMSVVAAPGGVVKSIADLEGSSVAISEGTQIEYLLDSYCAELGIDISKVEKVSIPSLSLRYEVLMENGEVDCALLPDPLSDVALINGAEMMIDDTTLENNYSISVIAATKDMIDDTELTENFIKAYNEAIDLLNNSPEDYRDFVISVANIPESLQDTYTIPHYIKNSVPTEDEVSSLVHWMTEKKLIEAAYTYEEVVDDSFCD